MRPTWILTCFGALALSSCSETQNMQSNSREIISQVEPSSSDAAAAAPENKFGYWEAMEASPDPFGENAADARQIAASTTTGSASEASGSTAPPPPATPAQQIAYSYGFGFRIEGDAVAELQQAHVAMCESMGKSCRVIRTSQARSDSWDAYGELQMQIAADEAGSLTEDLSAPAEELGGALVSSVRDGEDLAEQIIDTEARLQSRLILRDKLTDILRSNRGSVADLVAAEKAVAEINEEIDATRSKLERFRTRIRYSDVHIEYEPAFGESQIGFVRPVMTSIRSIGSTLGMTVAALVYALTALLPVVLLILAVRWVLHRFGLRLRFWKKDLPRSQDVKASA